MLSATLRAVEDGATSDTYALLIGIDAYGGGVPPLRGCVNDIDAVQRLLVDRLGVRRDRVTRLVCPHEGAAHETDVASSPATRDHIVRALTRLGDEDVTAHDRVFVYYSGHGASVAVAGEGFTATRESLVPVDAVVSDAGPVGLLFDVEFNRLLARIAERTSQVTVILDCCHSGGATRDAFEHPGDVARHLAVETTVTAAALDPQGALATRSLFSHPGMGAEPSGKVSDCLIVAACLADEKALECTDEDGRKHGLLTQTLVKLLRALDPVALREMSWGQIWRQVVAGVESKRPQHPTLAGSFARPVFGGPPREGDRGYGVQRDGNEYRLDVGELSGVYPSAPATFPPLDTEADRTARVGLLRVVRAKRAESYAKAEGAPFELPQGARARLVEPGASARLVVDLSPPDPVLARRIAASPRLRLAADGENPAVRLVRCANGDRALTDAIHGTGDAPGDAWLVRIPPELDGKTVAVLEHYVRYAAPFRMAEACTDLPGALRFEYLDCNGRDRDADDRLLNVDAQSPDLPEVPIGTDGVYTRTEGDLVCARVTNTSNVRLKVTLFDCAPDGCVAWLGEEVLGPRKGHVFWWGGDPGRPFALSALAGRSVSLDRVVAIGTSAVEKSLRYMEMAPDDTFESVLNERPMGAPGRYPTPERWTAVRITLRVRRH